MKYNEFTEEIDLNEAKLSGKNKKLLRDMYKFQDMIASLDDQLIDFDDDPDKPFSLPNIVKLDRALRAARQEIETVKTLLRKV